MVLHNVPNANVPRRAFSSITPFTYPDGITHLELLEKLRYYATVILPKSIEDTLGEFDADITERLEATLADVISRLETQTEWVEGEISGLRDEVNAAVEAVINSSIEMQDAVYAGLLRQEPPSEARDAFREVIADDYNEWSIDLFPGDDDTAKLQAAIDAATAAQEDRVIVTPRPITIERTIRWDIGYSSLRFGRGIVTSTVEDGPTFTVHNTRAGLTGNTNKWLDTMELRGPGRGTDSVAFEFHSPSPDYPGNTRGLCIRNAEVRNFGTAYKIQDNAYLISFENVHTWGYDIGCHMPSGYRNYGEKITFRGSNFGSGGTAILNENADGDIYVIGGSVDFAAKLAEARGGIINFESCHLEFRHNDVTAPIATTHANRAQVSIRGGRLMFHGTSPKTDYLFFTEGTPWGMGIIIDGTELFNADCTEHIMCGGTGLIKTNNIQTTSSGGGGYSVEAVIPAVSQNRLIDPTFGSAAGDYANVLDAFIYHASATSRTESPDLAIQQIAPGRLRPVKRATSGYGTVMDIIVPLTGDLTKEWASGFRITNAPSVGSFSFAEGFVYVSGYDSRGIPIYGKADMRSASVINLVDRPAPFKIRYGYTAFDRHERPWATHFRVSFNFRALAESGSSASLNFADIIMAAR